MSTALGSLSTMAGSLGAIILHLFPFASLGLGVTNYAREGWSPGPLWGQPALLPGDHPHPGAGHRVGSGSVPIGSQPEL